MTTKQHKQARVPRWYHPLLAVQFLTRLPVTLSGQVAESDLAEAMSWYPLVGGALGAFTAACATGLTAWLPAHISAALALAFLSIITGNLHLDGLMDTADGFYGGYTRERRLEIMRDSRVGAHGVAAGIVTLLLKWSLIWALLQSQRLVWALPLALSASRWSLVLMAKSQPSARKDGLGRTYAKHLRPRHLVWATLAWIAAVATALFLKGSLGPTGVPDRKWTLALVTAPAISLLFGRYVTKKIGGLTGDTLGATSELVELAVLLVLSIGAL